MSEENIQVYKLVSGEEIMGNEVHRSQMSYKIKDPYKVVAMSTGQFTVIPWLFASPIGDEVEIMTQFVMATSVPDDEFTKGYHQARETTEEFGTAVYETDDDGNVIDAVGDTDDLEGFDLEGLDYVHSAKKA